METAPQNSRRFIVVVKILAVAAVVFLLFSFGVSRYKAKMNANSTMGGNTMSQSIGSDSISEVMPQKGMPIPGNAKDRVDKGRGTIGPNDALDLPSEPVDESGVSVSMDSEVEDATIEKQAIKTADMELKVQSIDTAIHSLRSIATSLGGDVYASSVNDRQMMQPRLKMPKTGWVTLKVPAEKFEEALSQAKAIARVVVSESTNTQDVTAQHFDLEARLKNKKSEEEMIVAILARETNKISDVLTVTQELARVRSEIEQLQSQITYIDGQVDMATFQIMLSEDEEIGVTDTSWRPTQEIKVATNKLLSALKSVVSFLINFFILVLPVLIILILTFGSILYLIIRRLFHWKNTKKTEEVSAPKQPIEKN